MMNAETKNISTSLNEIEIPRITLKKGDIRFVSVSTMIKKILNVNIKDDVGIYSMKVN
ncbi:hypothetical protein ACNF42_07835 [Cuniculiplasma sp. SKW3]|uniref:hypothetical protein n=1 Tax=Cuniculiplasma sp. SKW3 TaxID=3400170 RepID=UPI003FD54F4D